MTPGRMDLAVYRNQPTIITIDIVGQDFSAAAFHMQVRLYRGVTGTPVFDLAVATAGSQGISRTVSTTDGIATTHLVLQFDEASIDAALPWPANGLEPNSDVRLAHDMHITPAGGTKARWWQGDFTIIEGVTI